VAHAQRRIRARATDGIALALRRGVDSREIDPPARLGPYVLGECIGRGGMALVHKSKVIGPRGFQKPVVLKQLLPSLTSNAEFVELFTSEAKITAQLGHPGIVQVLDFGVAAGAPYLVMEFLDGVNLSQLLHRVTSRGQLLPVEVAVVILTQVCHALGYAHAYRDAEGVRRQVVHGDVSPSNIMVCRDGSVKLLDFGVAKLLGEFDFDLPLRLTGKSAYMAPEQLRRHPFDRHVDVFAAGIVLHEMLTGRRLFAAGNEVETLHRVLAGEVLPPSVYNPSVSPALDAVTLRALAPDPMARFDSGEELALALGAACCLGGGGRRRVATCLAHAMAPPNDVAPGDGMLPVSTTAEAEPHGPPARPRVRSITEMVRPVARVPTPPSPIVVGVTCAFFGIVATPAVTKLLRPPLPPRATISLHASAPPRRLARVVRAVLAHPDPSSPPAAPPPAALVTPSPASRPPPRAPRPARPPRVEPAPRLAPAPPVAAPPAPAAAPARVKDGRLLDPFGDTP
jgi:serine/threonine-protein kinase